jgi:hypothetical protein
VYTTLSGKQLSYVYDGATWTTLDHPDGSNGTTITGIYNTQYVGYYQDSSGTTHGFSYDGSNWSTISAPNAGPVGTFVEAIYGNTIVGSYRDSDYFSHGFAKNGETFTIIDVPGSPFTVVKGIYENTIVGSYYDSNWSVQHGFIFDGSTFDTVDNPNAEPTPRMGGSYTFTDLSDIYGTTVVGFHSLSSGDTQGFAAVIPEPSTYALLLLSGAASLWALRRRKS